MKESGTDDAWRAIPPCDTNPRPRSSLISPPPTHINPDEFDDSRQIQTKNHGTTPEPRDEDEEQSFLCSDERPFFGTSS